ncbi:prepilin-type N-terminal cleavage/methylation domain-containing protein [Moritella marina ATCC 15381]|uniref:Prepilin-type N-terminal cleavage/methylation domain-containing protein n=2 Tax=Moritella marina TaxID=90736 RepID=A0A5J6WLQ5_MORMI|nr:prepilin-type N-terminal cleavage/methylation domain-containing protein [Moritella marina ATCC 15381]
MLPLSIRAKAMNKQQGFTLIELVIIIIVLGILAAIAIPKFTNLSSDARLASLRGMEGAMRSGANLIHSKAVIIGADKDAITTDIDGVNMQLHSGYPVGNWINGIRYIVNLDAINFSQSATICDADWCGRGNQVRLPSGITTTQPGRIGKVYPRGYSWNDKCGVYYINHEDGRPAVIGLETEDCK